MAYAWRHVREIIRAHGIRAIAEMQNCVSAQNKVNLFLAVINGCLAIATWPEHQFAESGNRPQNTILAVTLTKNRFIGASSGRRSRLVLERRNGSVQPRGIDLRLLGYEGGRHEQDHEEERQELAC